MFVCLFGLQIRPESTVLLWLTELGLSGSAWTELKVWKKVLFTNPNHTEPEKYTQMEAFES